MRHRRPQVLTTRSSVSVVIPCYNYGRFLPGAVASALDQAGLDVNVLIVDDCSNDGSSDVALELARRDSRIDVLLHEQNRGHIRTYNDGLAKATGDYVALLSADDLLGRNSLSRAVALMEAHPTVGLVYGWAAPFDSDPAPGGDRGVRGWSVWGGRSWLELAVRRGRCFLRSPEAVMRRDALLMTDGYDERLPHSADFAMWLQTAAHWDIGRVNGPVQAFYRVHDANMHLTTFAGWLTDLVERRRTFEILFTEGAVDEALAERLRPLAMRALAREAARRGFRARHDPSEPREAAEAYFAFARDTDPGSCSGLRWQVEQRRPSGGGSGAAGSLSRFASRANDHVEWRRRRRYGT